MVYEILPTKRMHTLFIIPNPESKTKRKITENKNKKTFLIIPLIGPSLVQKKFICMIFARNSMFHVDLSIIFLFLFFFMDNLNQIIAITGNRMRSAYNVNVCMNVHFIKFNYVIALSVLPVALKRSGFAADYYIR